MIRAIFLDLDGTLVNSEGRALDGVPAMLEQLADIGFQLAVLTNRGYQRAKKRLDRAGLPPLEVFANDSVNAKKMSGKLHVAAARALDVELSEAVSVGDTKQDSIAAINAGVLPLGAKWGGGKPPYSLGFQSPKVFLAYARTVLRIDPRWYWSLDTSDAQERIVHMRALLEAGDNQSLYRTIYRVLKEDANPKVQGANFRKFLVAYLTSVLYQEGLLREVRWWAEVPPSSARTARTGISDLVGVTSDFFRIKYLPDLIGRHRPAEKSAYLRKRGEIPTFDNQIQTLMLNDDHRGMLGDETVLLTDDFITRGLSMEGCRNFLVAGGASKVIAVAVGRFGRSAVELFSPEEAVRLDPWRPCTLAESDFETARARGEFDPDAVTQFEEAWKVFVRAVSN